MKKERKRWDFEKDGPDWRFLEKHVPGVRKAWPKHLLGTEFNVGITGKPSRCQATDRGCYEPDYTGCRCMRFVDGKWVPHPHEPFPFLRRSVIPKRTTILELWNGQWWRWHLIDGKPISFTLETKSEVSGG